VRESTWERERESTWERESAQERESAWERESTQERESTRERESARGAWERVCKRGEGRACAREWVPDGGRGRGCPRVREGVGGCYGWSAVVCDVHVVG
jgi:hypothetical protein